MTRAVLDRIEGDRAVLEIAGREVVVPAALLPERAREGDALEIAVAPAHGAARAAADVARRRKKLSRGDPGGDVDL